MNQTPKFAAAISESQRLDAQTAATTAAANAARETTRQRLSAVALEQLTHLVLPLLEQARAALSEAGIVAEVGNGRDAYGCLRHSLRILSGQGFPPALTFTATHTGPRPHIGHHSEFHASPRESFPIEIPEVSEDCVTSIITQFLAKPKLPHP